MGGVSEIPIWHVACQARGGCNSPQPPSRRASYSRRPLNRYSFDSSRSDAFVQLSLRAGSSAQTLIRYMNFGYLLVAAIILRWPALMIVLVVRFI